MLNHVNHVCGPFPCDRVPSDGLTFRVTQLAPLVQTLTWEQVGIAILLRWARCQILELSTPVSVQAQS